MKCDFCSDTGSLAKSRHGLLDCAHCGIADARKELDTWTDEHAPDAYSDDSWLIYKRGMAAGAAPLLAALSNCARELEACARQLKDEGYIIGPTIQAPLDAARAAIASATGSAT